MAAGLVRRFGAIGGIPLIVVFRIELRRQIRRLLPYALLAGLVVITVLIHVWMIPKKGSEVDLTPQIFAQPQMMAALFLLELGALVLTLPLVARDKLAGAQEAVLLTGTRTSSYVVGKFAAALVILAGLSAIHLGLVCGSCWLQFRTVPLGTVLLFVCIVTIPATFLSAAAGLFVGTTTRNVLVQLLVLFFMVAAVLFMVISITAPSSRLIGPLLLDLDLTSVSMSLADWADAGWRAEEMFYRLRGTGHLVSYELRQILTQRAFLVALGILLTVISCGLIRVRETDHSKLWKSRLPFHKVLHRLIVFEGQGKWLGASLVASLALVVFLDQSFVRQIEGRMKRLSRLSERASADMSYHAARISFKAIAIDLTLGTRMHPLGGTCDYTLETPSQTTLRFVVNPGLRITAAALDGHTVQAVQDMERVDIGSATAGPHQLRVQFQGFLDNYYRTAVYGCSFRPRTEIPYGMYYYAPEFPAIERMTSRYCWLLPEDRWLPLPTEIDLRAPARCDVKVSCPVGWTVAFPGCTTSVENHDSLHTYNFYGTYSPSELSELSVVAGEFKTTSQQVGGRQVDIYYARGARVEESELLQKLAELGGFLNEIDPDDSRPILAVGGSAELINDLVGTPCLLMPFEQQTVRIPLYALWNMEQLVPTSEFCGKGAGHPLINDGLALFLGASARIDRLGVAGLSEWRANTVVGDPIGEKKIVLSRWDEIPKRTLAELLALHSSNSFKALHLLAGLSNILGHERLLSCAKRLFREYHFREVTPQDFIRIINEEAAHAGIDLKWFWEDYYEHACLANYAIPEPPVTWKLRNGDYAVIAKIVNRWDGRMIVPVVIKMESDTWRSSVFVDKEATLKVELGSRPVRIEVDPDGKAYRSAGTAISNFQVLDGPPAGQTDSRTGPAAKVDAHR